MCPPAPRGTCFLKRRACRCARRPRQHHPLGGLPERPQACGESGLTKGCRHERQKLSRKHRPSLLLCVRWVIVCLQRLRFMAMYAVSTVPAFHWQNFVCGPTSPGREIEFGRIVQHYSHLITKVFYCSAKKFMSWCCRSL